ncbi:SIMPL domain-containing protein [Stappia sp.]|uniref:SIMPL domain-containing protein n=1 Tax=Stappia sp. TaxID=1870903 RepID=UPI003A9A60CA
MRSLQTAGRIALFSAAVALAATTLPARAETPRVATIDMVGTGTVTAAPDMAILTSGVVSDADTAGDAMSANTAAMSAVIGRIKDSGIEERDIQTSGFSVQPRYRQVKSGSLDNGEYRSEIVGYRVTNNVSVRVRDLAKLGGLLDTMVRDGANQVGGVNFIVSDADKLKDEARKEATADAIRKAKIYAEPAGIKLGRVLSISEQDYSPRPMMMMARAEMKMDGAAPAPIEAGETALDVRVNISWEIAQ